MNSLGDWRNILQTRGVKVTKFTGHSLDADGSTWMLEHDLLYRDGEPFSKKQVKDYLKTKPLTLIAP